MSSYTRYSLVVVITLAIAAGVILWGGFLEPEESLLPSDQPDITAPSSTKNTVQPLMATSSIGTSVEGRSITAYTAGNGSTHLLFVGGIHGGYEWNSVVVAYNLIDYLRANPQAIPDNLTVSVIPSANPDAVYDVVGTTTSFTAADVPTSANLGGPERFNANGVDLNRNFDCQWQPRSRWRSDQVNAGSRPFGEPEARAIRDFVRSNKPDAAVFFHSAAGAVYGAACESDTISSSTRQLVNTYADASGYRAVDRFTAYKITGDVESWLTKQGVPAVSVELTNHQDVEWQKNLSGIKALLNLYAK